MGLVDRVKGMLGMKPKAPEGVVPPQPGAAEAGGMPMKAEGSPVSPLGSAPVTPEGGMPAKTEAMMSAPAIENVTPVASASPEGTAPVAPTSPEGAVPVR